MHGTELRDRERRTLRLSTPRQPLLTVNGSKLSDSPQPSLPPGTGCSCRPFAHLQRPPLSRKPFQGQSSWPVTSPLDQPVPLPVRPFCSATGSGSPRSPAASLLLARCSISGQPYLRFLQPPLPFGNFASLGIKAFNWTRRSPARLPNPPDAVRSPQPLSITSFPTADHRSRPATFSEACCSSNLLEPFSLCAGRRILVNSFLVRFFAFPQVLSPVFL